jgi:hypothetical protein
MFAVACVNVGKPGYRRMSLPRRLGFGFQISMLWSETYHPQPSNGMAAANLAIRRYRPTCGCALRVESIRDGKMLRHYCRCRSGPFSSAKKRATVAEISAALPPPNPPPLTKVASMARTANIKPMINLARHPETQITRRRQFSAVRLRSEIEAWRPNFQQNAPLSDAACAAPERSP